MPDETHFYVLTLEKPLGPGLSANASFAGTLTPNTGTTRAHVYQDLYQDYTRLHPELAGASVLFFSLEPNQL